MAKTETEIETETKTETPAKNPAWQFPSLLWRRNHGVATALLAFEANQGFPIFFLGCLYRFCDSDI